MANTGIHPTPQPFKPNAPRLIKPQKPAGEVFLEPEVSETRPAAGRASKPHLTTPQRQSAPRPAPIPRISPSKSTKAKNLSRVEQGRKAAAITMEEREERRLRVLNGIQQARVMTKADIDRICGYEQGRTRNAVIQSLLRRGEITQLEGDGRQALYAITARGNENADSPLLVKPMTARAWAQIAQTEHMLGVAAILSRLLSPNKFQGATWDTEGAWQNLLQHREAFVLGEAAMKAAWLAREGAKKYPSAAALQRLYGAHGERTTLLDPSEILMEADLWVLPPFLALEKGGEAKAITEVRGDGRAEAGAYTEGDGVKGYHYHLPDAAVIPVSGEPGLAIELERNTKSNPVLAYRETMRRYGSSWGRKRFGDVLWVCKSEYTRRMIEQAAEDTETTDLTITLGYTTALHRRNSSFIRGANLIYEE